MRKIIVLLLAMCVAMPLMAGDDRSIDKGRLPATAKEFIAKHFEKAEISLATMDKELFDTTYDVFFTDGNKVEFDKNGEWKEVSCKYSRVPESVIPKQIKEFVAAKHPGRYAKEIEKDKYYYEVKLDSGLELKFDKKFRLVDYDD